MKSAKDDLADYAALEKVLSWKPWSGLRRADYEAAIHDLETAFKELERTRGGLYAELLQDCERYLRLAKACLDAGQEVEAFGWLESCYKYKRWMR